MSGINIRTAFYLATSLKSGGCAAGEPIVARFQPRSADGVVNADPNKGEFFLAFFTDAREDLGRYDAKIASDLTGDFADWVLAGSVSNDLYEAAHRSIRGDFYEDLADGSVDEIAQFAFTITLAAPWKVTNANPNAAFARHTFRVTRSDDALDAFSTPRFAVTVLPYGSIATPTSLPAPSFAAAPSISGSAIVVQTLTGLDGTIHNGAVSARQWLRNGSPISGAIGSSDALVTADGGTSVAYRVTATGSGGSTSATLTSRTVAAAYRRVCASLLRGDQPLCRYCRSTGLIQAATVVDHIVALSLGGINNPNNLAPACQGCRHPKSVDERRFVSRRYDVRDIMRDSSMAEWLTRAHYVD